MSELPKSLIEVKILPITCCLHCPDKEKGQNRSTVLQAVPRQRHFLPLAEPEHPDFLGDVRKEQRQEGGKRQYGYPVRASDSPQAAVKGVRAGAYRVPDLVQTV